MSEASLTNTTVNKVDVRSIKRKEAAIRLFKGFLFLLPSLLLFGVFLFYPMVKTVYLSLFLTNSSGETTLFVGLKNYIETLTSPLFLNSMKVTGLFVLYTVPPTIIFSLFLALLANEKLKGVGVYRTIFSSSMGISTAAASVFWLFLFHPTIGGLNQILQWMGLDTIAWLTDPQWSLFSVSLSTIWMNTGFTFLILLGGLQSIHSYLYESAQIDGASYWYQLRRITIPMLSPTLFFVVTVTLINAFQTFGQIDMLTKGGPQNSTNLIVYSIYRDAFVNYQYGLASTKAVILFIIILLLTFVQFKLGERKVHYQ
ncbi:carbohydrate ABC transporter permease [Bacillus xiapuensis]|uniref:carbohydrate ABC transporter permease n=1 Tax=Bacillus xiapuensis TaxID=2014075 RepID=UPI000C23BFFA|nr:sugar ABC transporter permease [Bacillus xiapuensis]